MGWKLPASLPNYPPWQPDDHIGQGTDDDDNDNDDDVITESGDAFRYLLTSMTNWSNIYNTFWRWTEHCHSGLAVHLKV